MLKQVLMLWSQLLPSYQQPSYQLRWIHSSLFSTRKDFNCLRHITAEKWEKMQIYFQVSPACRESKDYYIGVVFIKKSPGTSSCGIVVLDHTGWQALSREALEVGIFRVYVIFMEAPLMIPEFLLWGTLTVTAAALTLYVLNSFEEIQNILLHF